ncbi:MAG: hypothetical protein AAGA27_02245 [Pseudomonadota bacterium]
MGLRIIRPDAKGRITLGKLAGNVSSYTITEMPDHRLILEPYVEIPAREKWLFDNKITLATIKKGLKQAAEGKLENKGSFSEFTDNNSI